MLATSGEWQNLAVLEVPGGEAEYDTIFSSLEPRFHI
jgi:hypothetical protein